MKDNTFLITYSRGPLLLLLGVLVHFPVLVEQILRDLRCTNLGSSRVWRGERDTCQRSGQGFSRLAIGMGFGSVIQPEL